MVIEVDSKWGTYRVYLFIYFFDGKETDNTQHFFDRLFSCAFKLNPPNTILKLSEVLPNFIIIYYCIIIHSIL